MAEESGRSEISDEHVVINVGSLVSSLEVELRNVRLSMQPSYCIFKTPSILYQHKPNSFHPTCFSIGPMHHGHKNLVPADKIKLKYLNGLLSRVAKSRTPETTESEEIMKIEQQKILTDLVNEVKLIEQKASAYYAGHDYEAELGDKLVKTMVLDGVFIIELFRKDAKEVSSEDDDPVFSMSCMHQFLNHDLILLENQIPWLVLETLFEKTKLPTENKPLIELALHFFETVFTSHRHPIEPGLFTGQDIKHILDLLRLSLVLPSPVIKKSGTTNEWQPIRSATKLIERGVKFKNVTPAASILDIKFSDGILEIPSLLVQETTETIFRNMIAYEQCLPHCDPIFTCYAKVLNNLIDNASDAEILCKKKILDNWFGYEDSAKFFNTLYHDAYFKKFYYSKLCEDLEKHCERGWPKWRAACVQNYFTKPWAIVAVIYAFIMFVLTLWQALTGCSDQTCKFFWQ